MTATTSNARNLLSPAPFFYFAAFVLLLLVTLSTPIWNDITFLHMKIDGQKAYFGVFGFTGSVVQLGYPTGQMNTKSDVFAQSPGLERLTYALIIHPIAAGVSLLAMTTGILGVAGWRAGSIVSTIQAGIAGILAILCVIFDFVLFTLVAIKLGDQGFPAVYGNAIWMTSGAAVSLIIGFTLSLCGVVRRSRARPEPPKYSPRDYETDTESTYSTFKA